MNHRMLLAPVAATALTAALLASAGSAQAPGGRTFKLIEKEDSFAFGDVAPRSSNKRNPSLSGGDQKVFTAKLFDEANAPVGKGYAQCVVAHGGRTLRQATFQCSGTYVLRDGSLTVSVGYRGDQREEDVAIAVTGGTGAYEGARGQISVRSLPGGKLEDTIHLVP